MFLPNMAQACLGPMLHSNVFLKSLPRDAFEKDVIALIEVNVDSKVAFQQYPPPAEKYVKAEIIENIKGFDNIEYINILVPTHTCYQGHEIKAGEKYFIAGSLDEDNIFTGEWKNNDLSSDQMNFM